MKEHPILFNGPMVRALLADRKTQTRRIVKPQPDAEAALGFLIPRPNAPGSCANFHDVDDRGVHSKELTVHCPYGQPGDRLWVRESWRAPTSCDHLPPRSISDSEAVRFVADETVGADAGFGKGRPGMFMPRWASRITLEIVSVRVERLQDISEADVLEEGCNGGHGSIPGYSYNASPAEHFVHVWASAYGNDSWIDNPWVWVVEFRRLP